MNLTFTPIYPLSGVSEAMSGHNIECANFFYKKYSKAVPSTYYLMDFMAVLLLLQVFLVIRVQIAWEPLGN